MNHTPGSVAALIINFNTSALTLRSVASLRGEGLRRILVLDNGSRPEDATALSALPAGVELVHSGVNTGFAGGCNEGIARLLEDPAVGAILLLNSDAVAQPGLVAAMASSLHEHTRHDMVAAAVMRLDHPDQVDSLGIAFYSCCIASNRMSAEDPLFGPTGGCALYSRRLLEDLGASHGHVFDPYFFCYAEDTDVAARALLLGYRPVMAEGAVALHQGQASSGGGFSKFVLYHGIRNSIWTMVKFVPARILARRCLLIACLHVGVVLRHVMRGEAGTVFCLYRDAALGLPRVLRQRRRVQRSRRVAARDLLAYMSDRFYERGYLRNALRELAGRRR